jgi:hypothetical protein
MLTLVAAALPCHVELLLAGAPIFVESDDASPRARPVACAPGKITLTASVPGLTSGPVSIKAFKP